MFMKNSRSRNRSRRAFLRSAGALLPLPWLQSLAAAGDAASRSAAPPRRMIAICTDLGLMKEYFFPQQTGRNYDLPPYLEFLKEFRDDFTVFSGLSHPQVDTGHNTDVAFLTAAPHPARSGFKNTISLDQFAAEKIGYFTRFPFLSLRIGPGDTSLSYTAAGARIPADAQPSRVFQKLFIQGTPAEVAAQIQQLREGRSLMDSFADRAKTLQRDVSTRDRETLDQYFTAVREVEVRLLRSEEWEQKPKPTVTERISDDFAAPGALVDRCRAMYQIAKLALETDSTRVIAIFIYQAFNPKVDLPGITVPHHALSHQTSIGESKTQLRSIEEAQMKLLAELLAGLKGVREKDKTLLDSTMVLHGSNLGDAARHDNRNLPILLAGGGFEHGCHLAFDAEHNTPLSNLFVTMLQNLGIEADRFASSTSPLTGL